MAVIHRRRAARRDLLDHFDYLEQHAGVETAVRFFAATQMTFLQLATMPQMAPLCGFEESTMRKLRRWPVKDFENWLIFYQPTSDGIEIVRVLHGARYHQHFGVVITVHHRPPAFALCALLVNHPLFHPTSRIFTAPSTA